jgi:antitoxin CptB
VLFRATHRGTQEADLLVGGFVAACISAVTEPELAALEEVLRLPDVDLADWLTGRREIPPATASEAMLRRMKAAAAGGSAA